MINARTLVSICASSVLLAGCGLAETTATELAVMGDGIDSPSANKTYYRVVAVDAEGNRSATTPVLVPSDHQAPTVPIRMSVPTNSPTPR